MKRVLSIATALCLALCLTVTAFAATLNPTLNKNKIKAGDDVTLTLTLDADIANVMTVGFKVYFNSDLFTLASNANGTSSNLTQISNVNADTKGSFYRVSVLDPTSNGVTVKKGVLYTLTFTAKADIAGTPNAQFEVVDDGGMDTSFGSISTAVGAAVSVTVEGAHVHTLNYVDAVVSTTCGSDDVAAHYECTVCGKLFSDAAGKNETTIDKLTTKKAHTLVKVDAVAATCTTNGTKEHYKCTNESCGRLFTDAAGKNETTADKLVIPAAHKLVKTDAKAATCTTPGNKEYWTCDVCKKVFSDAAGKNKIALADTTIAALGHELTKTEKVDSTCTATGHEAYWTCSRCKGIFADE